MKPKRSPLLPAALSLFFCLMLSQLSFGATQSVTELQNSYSGTTNWNAASHTLTFTTSGTINFNKPDYKSYFWDVPQEVSTIIINANVTVTGAFHTYYNCTVRGMNRSTSIIFGDNEQRWALNRDLEPWKYCQFENLGGVLTVENLTVLNPFAYCIRGWGTVCHTRNCDYIDNRGGWYNHSDGIMGGHGSTIDNCYFELGDDVLKCYFDMTITNVTINMIQNSVPFALGWNNYQDSNIKASNITIFGTWGRAQVRPIFQWKAGADLRTILIDGLYVDNPTATLFDLVGEGSLNLEIKNAQINVKTYGTSSFPRVRRICGTETQSNTYNCAENYSPADYDQDDDVDFVDFQVLVTSWLKQPGDPNYDSRANLDNDPLGHVDFRDYAIFAEYWAGE